MDENRDIRLRVIGEFEIKLSRLADVVPPDLHIDESGGLVGVVVTVPGGERIVVPVDRAIARALGNELLAFAGPSVVLPDPSEVALLRSRG